MEEGVQHQRTREALQYLFNHAEALQRYCEDDCLPMTNIRAKHVAKAIALARFFPDTRAGVCQNQLDDVWHSTNSDCSGLSSICI